VNRLWLSLLPAALLFWAAPAIALTVAIAKPPSPSPATTETLVRLHGELLSVGLDVKIVERPAAHEPDGRDTRGWLEKLAADRGLCAIIDVVGDVAPAAVDVWVVDKVSRRFEFTRVSVEPDSENASERLAIRAIEVLRSSFLEIDLAARQRLGEPLPKTAPPPPTLAAVRPSEPPPPGERLLLELGGAALTSLDGVGPAILPLLRLGWAVRPRFVLQVETAGFGTRPTVATTAGSARVAQHYGVLGACYRSRSQQWIQPFLSLSAGALRTSVEGQADSPRQGHTETQWSFLLDGSLGAALPLPGRYYLTLAAHTQIAAPYVAIHFVDKVVATSGRPNLLLTVTVGAWL
jgi:hypothetical protein